MALALLVTTTALAATGPALAGSITTRAKWKNCSTTQAGLSATATFTNVAGIYGPGRYLVKKQIRWDRLIGSGRWRAGDVHTTQTSWITISNTQYDFRTRVADRTTWGNAYFTRWRAHVIVKLIKNRRGPKDKKVDQIDLYPTTGSFREVGSCGTPVPGTLPGGRNGK